MAQKRISNGGFKWQFYDQYDTNAATRSYDFPINPKQMDTVHPERRINTMASTAGNALLFEGATAPQPWSFSGVLLTKAMYESLQSWVYTRKRRVIVMDHFGRQHLVVLQRFDAKPVRSIQYFWRHEYTITCQLIVSGSALIGDIYTGGTWRA